MPSPILADRPASATRITPIPSFGVRIPPCERLQLVADMAALAERRGFDAVWIPDSQMLWRDAFAAMAFAASVTERVSLGCAVANVRTRHPSVIASAVRTVQEIAPDRVRLGLGSGDSSVRLVGERPTTLRELRSGVSVIHDLTAGVPRVFNGHERKLRDPMGPCPIYLAASGPKTLELAGEITEGVIVLSGHSQATMDYIRAHLSVGAERARRDVAHIDVIVSIICHITEDLDRDLPLLKPVCLGTARQLGAAAFLRLAGISIGNNDLAETYPDIMHAEDEEEAIRIASLVISDDVALQFARSFCLFGSPASIQDQIRDATRRGVTGFLLRPLGQREGNYRLPEKLIKGFTDLVLPAFRQTTPA